MVTDAECPTASALLLIRIYGLPPVVPAAFISVTPAGRPVSTSCTGPAIDCWPTFCTVTVLLYVRLDRLNVKFVAVTFTRLVTSVVTEAGFADASFDIALVPLAFAAAT